MSGGHKCDGCFAWLKMHKDIHGGGLCALHDRRASSDDSCDSWRDIPYKRETKKIKVHEVDDN